VTEVRGNCDLHLRSERSPAGVPFSCLKNFPYFLSLARDFKSAPLSAELLFLRWRCLYVHISHLLVPPLLFFVYYSTSLTCVRKMCRSFEDTGVRLRFPPSLAANSKRMNNRDLSCPCLFPRLTKDRYHEADYLSYVFLPIYRLLERCFLSWSSLQS